MASLPTPGGDDGVWANKYNTFLEVSHEADGTLKASAVQAVQPSTDYAIKAYADVSGTTLNAQRNVSGVTNPSTGVYVVSWDTDFSSANYAVNVTAIDASVRIPQVISKLAGSATVQFSTFNGNPIAVTGFSIIAIGNLA